MTEKIVNYSLGGLKTTGNSALLQAWLKCYYLADKYHGFLLSLFTCAAANATPDSNALTLAETISTFLYKQDDIYLLP